MEKEKLLNKIEAAGIAAIEDFLGYPITNEIIEDLRTHLEDTHDQMPEEELELFMKKYGQ